MNPKKKFQNAYKFSNTQKCHLNKLNFGIFSLKIFYEVTLQLFCCDFGATTLSPFTDDNEWHFAHNMTLAHRLFCLLHPLSLKELLKINQIAFKNYSVSSHKELRNKHGNIFIVQLIFLYPSFRLNQFIIIICWWPQTFEMTTGLN